MDRVEIPSEPESEKAVSQEQSPSAPPTARARALRLGLIVVLVLVGLAFGAMFFARVPSPDKEKARPPLGSASASGQMPAAPK